MVLGLLRRRPPSLVLPEHAVTAVKHVGPIASNELVLGKGSVVWNLLDHLDKLIQDTPVFVGSTKDAAFAVDAWGRLCKG